MKRLIVLLFFSLALAATAAAQNIIVTNGGDAIKAYNIEMAGNSVFYQTSEASDAAIQKIAKSDILIIKMQDGTKIDPNEPEKAEKQEAAPAAVSGSIIKLSGDAAAKNAEMIAAFNKELTWEPDEKFNKKGRGKIGNGYAGVMWIEEDSQLYNGELTISFQRLYDSGFSTGGGSSITDYRGNAFVSPYVVVKVKNNTDRIIYLDLASSFVICGENSTPYFVPVTTMVNNTSTSQKTSDYTTIKVTDDKVKSSDHTYVSGNTSSVTSVKEAQRYISVAPKATLSLEPQMICKSDNGRDRQMYNYLGYLYMSGNVFPFKNTPYGEIYEMSEEDSPFHFGSSVAYTFNEDHSDVRTIRTEMYMRYVMCTSSTGLFSYTIEGDFHRRYPFWVPFYVSN